LTWDWNPYIVEGAIVDPGPYYPSPGGNVDWIGADGYQQIDPNTGEPKTIGAIFGAWYTEFGNSTYNKPMMIGETGSCEEYQIPLQSTDQVSYINTLSSTLAPPDVTFPQVQALIYFDANGMYTFGQNNTPCLWNLNPNINPGDSISGLQAFANLADSPTFSATVTEP
jgi:beta-mannanase